MANRSFLKSGSKAAIAAGIALIALPSIAMADPEDNGRGNRGRGTEMRGENRGGGEGRGSWQQRQQPAAAQQAQVQAAPQAQVHAAPQARVRETPTQQVRGYTGGENRTAPWVARTQQAPDRTRDDRTGSNDSWRGRQGGGDERWRTEQRSEQRANQRTEQRSEQRRTDGWRGDQSRTDQRRDNYRWSGGDNNRRWDRDWRRDNRYNWNDWRRSNRGTFHLGNYYAPYRGWNYRRIGIGIRLESLFFSPTYWIGDPWSYRLPDVYGPYRWVRYYDDALLVNIYTGEVVDVVYDIFW
jgi:hypothetical protein